MSAPKYRDRTGAELGRLKVIEYAGTRMVRNRMRATWSCRCSCGTVKVIDSDCLRTVRSCGCLRRETATRSMASLIRPARPKATPPPRVARPERLPNLRAAQTKAQVHRVKRGRVTSPRHWPLKGLNKESRSIGGKKSAGNVSMDEFSANPQARVEWLTRMSLVGRLITWKHSVRYASYG